MSRAVRLWGRFAEGIVIATFYFQGVSLSRTSLKVVVVLTPLPICMWVFAHPTTVEAVPVVVLLITTHTTFPLLGYLHYIDYQ